MGTMEQSEQIRSAQAKVLLPPFERHAQNDVVSAHTTSSTFDRSQLRLHILCYLPQALSAYGAAVEEGEPEEVEELQVALQCMHSLMCKGGVSAPLALQQQQQTEQYPEVPGWCCVVGCRLVVPFC